MAWGIPISSPIANVRNIGVTNYTLLSVKLDIITSNQIELIAVRLFYVYLDFRDSISVYLLDLNCTSVQK